MSMQQPMIDNTKELEAAIAEPVAELKAKYEAKATSLRRASTALLFFSVICSRPWPSAGWIGIIASIATLCASSQRLLCRARVARFLSFVVAIFAAYTAISLIVKINSGMPQEFGDKVRTQCLKMPADSFEWAHQIVTDHSCMRKGISFLSRHMSNDITDPPVAMLAVSDDELVKQATQTNASHVSMPVTSPSVIEQEWSQTDVCHKAGRVVSCFAKMMMIGSAVAHFFLFLAAAAVVKNVCCLRCVAYRSGLLKWPTCGACKYAGKTTTPVVMPGAKELA